MLGRSKKEDAKKNPPLLELRCDGEEDATSGRVRWWNRLINDEEAKTQILFSLPMIVTNSSYYLIPLVLAMFASYLGDLELVGATLSKSWATVSGFAFMVAFAGDCYGSIDHAQILFYLVTYRRFLSWKNRKMQNDKVRCVMCIHSPMLLFQLQHVIRQYNIIYK